MSAIIRFKRGNSANWTSNGNIILSSGEPGYEIDTGRTKIGDGVTPWNDLYYSSIVPTGFISGSGIRLDIAENGSSATISISGLISNPANNRILTSRDNTTTGIDAETNLVFDGSRLGVNTSNPSGALHIIGSGIIASTTGTRPNALLSLYSSVSGDTLFNVFSNNGNLFSITNNVTGSLLSVNDSLGLPAFQVSTDPSISGGRFLKNDLVLTSGGNLGLGTNNPLYKLHVDGSGFFRSGLYISGLVVSNTGILDRLVFNTGLDDPDLLSGQLQWNTTEGTLDLGLNDNYTMHLGEEMLYRIKNTTGATLRAGQPVYASGLSSGSNNRIEVNLYAANGDIREIRFMGLMTVDCPDNGNSGYATHFGYIRGVDTNGGITEDYSSKLWVSGEPDWLQGDILYVHPSVPGKLTKIEPKHSISVAIITSKGNNGKLFVRPTSYGHLNDNHDVEISGVTNGQFLQYNSSTDYWIPSSSGNFTTLLVNGTGVSVNGHTHTSSDITNFNSSVSGLIPTTIVHTTGNQTIDGVKTFNSTITALDNIYLNDSSSNLISFNGNGLSNPGSAFVSSSPGDKIILHPFAFGSAASFGFGIAGGGTGGSAPAEVLWSQVGKTSNSFDWYAATTKVATLTGSGILTIQGATSQINVDNLRLDGNILSTTNTNGALILNPNGNGALQRDSGGDARGQYAIDWQSFRLSSDNVAGANYSVIGGGLYNVCSGFGGTICGGSNNRNFATYGAIGGGSANQVYDYTTTIAGGERNIAIDYGGFIGGGTDNIVGTGISSNFWNTIAGGRANISSRNYSFIGGGQANLCSGTAAVVCGGQNNKISGSYGAILGGRNNNDNGLDNIFILGSNITGTQIDTTYTQNLISNATGDINILKINNFYHNNLSIATGLSDTDLLIGIIDPTGLSSTEVIQGSVLRNTLLNQPAQLQFRQGTDAERLLITPASGEPIWTTDTQKFYIGDGTTIGGDFIGPSPYDRGSGIYSIIPLNGGFLYADNNSLGSYSSILGGFDNIIHTNGFGSVICGGATNIASGILCFIGGGGQNPPITTNHIAVGDFSAIVGGVANHAYGKYSHIGGGYYAKTTKHGEVAHAAGRFANNGDAQHIILMARALTVNSTPRILTLDGSADTLTLPNTRLTLPEETTWTFEIKLSAYIGAYDEGAWWIIRGGIKRDASNNTLLIGSPIIENGAESELALANVVVAADTVNNALEIIAQPPPSTSQQIRWFAVIDIAQVSYGVI